MKTVLFLLLIFNHCSKSPSTKTDENPLVERGRAVYQSNCIACHNPNPKLAGVLGPEIWGSTRELIEARVIRGGYPVHYKPKRSTKLMVPLPTLQAELDALYLFLNSK